MSIPKEFAWIKPGVKMANKDYPNHRAIAQALPHWAKNHACWLVAVDGGGYWQCDIAIPADKAPITLTLTRHQAQALLLQVQKLDGVSRGFIEDEKFYREIEKQIEEKLK